MNGRAPHPKRLFDLLISLLALLLLSPLLGLLALLVGVKLGLPVFFCQQRPGLHGQLFILYKFRTMTVVRDKQGNLLSDSERLTKLGRFMRRTSLDELPELWNVLKGDMSLVGPRPLLQEYLPYYTQREQLRHTVRPGITGWAQINGRNLVKWDERLEMDVWYVENMTIWLDLRILVETILKVLVRKDVVDAPGTLYDKLNVYREKTKVANRTGKEV